jgi:sugar phosphate isomerase/epimerase
MMSTDLGPGDLVLPHFAMIDVEPGPTFVSRSFADRCVAAANGGFRGIGITHQLYQAEWDAGRSDAELVDLAHEHGVVVSEVESVGMPGPAARDDLDRTLDAVLHVADVFGATRFFVIPVAGVGFEDHVETFQWLCARCAQHGVSVGIEFMDLAQVSAVRDLDSASRVVDAADQPNGGLCLDTYHYFNSSSTWEQLEQLDGDRVVMVQLSDGRIPRTAPDYLSDTLHHRLPPGDGDFDLERFVRVMDAIGARCPYSLEVLNDELRTMEPSAMGEMLGAAGRRVLAAVRA